MTIDRRTVVLGAAILLLALRTAPVQAAQWIPFDAGAFRAAQDSGRPVIVHVTASWCPTCKAQRPILSRLLERPEFRDLTVFNVDFDAQKEIVRSFDVRMQSTFVVYKGRTETARSVGETRPEAIEALLRKAL